MEGYCIEYRESQYDHFYRYGKVWEKKPISFFAIGMERGMYLGVLGAQGLKGDRDDHMKEPSIFNVPLHMFWVEWNTTKGMPKATA